MIQKAALKYSIIKYASHRSESAQVAAKIIPVKDIADDINK